MLLCLGIIEDALGKRALYKNYDKEDDPFVLERPEIYRRARSLPQAYCILRAPPRFMAIFSTGGLGHNLHRHAARSLP